MYSLKKFKKGITETVI